MTSPTRMTLQLTPLLDLLLIVIFAQYLDVRESQVVIETRAAALQQELNESQQQLKLATGALQDVRQELRLMDDQQQVLGVVLQELFQIPQDELRRLLQRKLPPGVRSAQELERLQEQVRELSQEQPVKLVEHLLSYEEIRKRCDLWDVHVTPDNFLVLSSGGKSARMQIPRDVDEDFVQRAFADRFIELSQALSEPKSLVILLMTYDRASQRWAVGGVRDVLPQIVLRLNFESTGRSRYAYADLGFRLEAAERDDIR